jgi:hypothetical protein
MTMDGEPAPEPRPGGRSARARSNPLASPWLTASLALIVIGLIAANLLASNLARLSGGGPTPSAPATHPGEASPSAAGSPSFTRPTPTPQPTFMAYVVRTGDSLNSIAARFETKARSIAWWNRGQYPSLDPESPTYNPGRIEVGWTLALIPGVTVDEENPPSPSPGRATPTPAASAPASTEPQPSTPPGAAPAPT